MVPSDSKDKHFGRRLIKKNLFDWKQENRKRKRVRKIKNVGLRLNEIIGSNRDGSLMERQLGHRDSCFWAANVAAAQSLAQVGEYYGLIMTRHSLLWTLHWDVFCIDRNISICGYSLKFSTFVDKLHALSQAKNDILGICLPCLFASNRQVFWCT